jgi:Prolyl-tRNA synthetase
VEAIALASAGEGDMPFRLGLAGADLLVLPLEAGGNEAGKAAEEMAAELERSGWAVLLDDRLLPDEARLAEATLTGSPVRVLVADAEGAVIVSGNGGGSSEPVPLEDVGRFLEPMRIV